MATSDSNEQLVFNFRTLLRSSETAKSLIINRISPLSKIGCYLTNVLQIAIILLSQGALPGRDLRLSREL
jgi:hypothetical protein